MESAPRWHLGCNVRALQESGGKKRNAHRQFLDVASRFHRADFRSVILESAVAFRSCPSDGIRHRKFHLLIRHGRHRRCPLRLDIRFAPRRDAHGGAASSAASLSSAGSRFRADHFHNAVPRHRSQSHLLLVHRAHCRRIRHMALQAGSEEKK